MTSRDPRQRWVAPGERFVEALRHEIADERRRNELGPITVVVPSFYSAYFLRRAIALEEPLFNVQFLRLEDFAETLIAREESRPPLSRLRATELVHAVAADESISLPPELDRIRSQDGFQRALHRTLDDLDAADVTPGTMARSGWRFTPAVLNLYGRYRELARGFVAASASAKRAARVVASGGPGLAGLGPIIFVLAEEPAVQHRELVSALIGYTGTRLLVQSTGEAESDVLLWGTDAASYTPGEETPSDRSLSTQPARLISVPDPAEEARWIVRDVLEAAREEGIPFARIGVFYEDRSYGPRLTEEFKLADVPVSGPSPMTLSQTARGRWILGLLATLNPEAGLSPGVDDENRFARDALAAWVTGSPVTAADGTPAPGAAWDVISRRAGVIGGPASWDAKLGRYSGRLITRIDRASRQEEDDRGSVASWNAELTEAGRLREFVNQLANEAIPSDLGSSWDDFVQWLLRLENKYGRAANDGATESITGLLESLRDLDALDLPSPTFQRFKRTLEQELDRPLPRVGTLGRGIFVAPLRQAVGCDFDRVYIVGMAEGSYPATGAEDPLLPDSARIGIPGLKTLSMERASARRRYLAALASAPRRVLVWPRSQPGATRQSWPARWFTEAAEAATDGPLPDDILADPNSPVTVIRSAVRQDATDSPVDRHEYGLKSLASWTGSGRDPEKHFLFREMDGLLSTGRDLERGRFRSRELTRWDGSVGPNSGPDVPWAPMSLSEEASSTRLETWANCPFRYFLTYEVGVEPTETPESAQTLSALDRGLIIHDILDEFVKETLQGQSPTGPTDAERLSSVIDHKLGEFERSGLTGLAVLWKLERERIRRGLLDFLDVHTARIADRGQRPVATELGFGDGKPVPPIVVELPGGRSIRFRGWIDRVDADSTLTEATVIDYKSGRSSYYSRVKDDPVDAGRHLQLPLYALAVQEWEPRTESIDAEFWFVMDEAGSRTVSTSLEIAAPRFREVVDRIVRGIEEGLFPAYPGERSMPTASGAYKPENCAYCAFDRICPGGRDWAWERKSTHEGVAIFAGLQAGAGDRAAEG